MGCSRGSSTSLVRRYSGRREVLMQCSRTIGPALQRWYTLTCIIPPLTTAQNAGISGPRAKFEDIKLEDFQQVVNINLVAVRFPFSSRDTH
jgi:NAD(P)-dependent dehydrogenase (short-subunit alcohol dehydrogenase family)